MIALLLLLLLLMLIAIVILDKSNVVEHVTVPSIIYWTVTAYSDTAASLSLCLPRMTKLLQLALIDNLIKLIDTVSINSCLILLAYLFSYLI